MGFIQQCIRIDTSRQGCQAQTGQYSRKSRIEITKVALLPSWSTILSAILKLTVMFHTRADIPGIR